MALAPLAAEGEAPLLAFRATLAPFSQMTASFPGNLDSLLLSVGGKLMQIRLMPSGGRGQRSATLTEHSHEVWTLVGGGVREGSVSTRLSGFLPQSKANSPLQMFVFPTLENERPT